MNANTLKGILTIISALAAVLPHAFPALAPFAEAGSALAAFLFASAHVPRPGDAKAAS